MQDLEQLIDKFIDMMKVIVPPFPNGDSFFPNGSCIAVSAFLIQFVRMARPEEACWVVIGKFDGKIHAWIECWHPSNPEHDYYIDATVGQFDSDAPRIVYTTDTQRYEPTNWLNDGQEADLRKNAEVHCSALSTRDGKRLLRGC